MADFGKVTREHQKALYLILNFPPFNFPNSIPTSLLFRKKLQNLDIKNIALFVNWLWKITRICPRRVKCDSLGKENTDSLIGQNPC
jgi:hypothetical protein